MRDLRSHLRLWPAAALGLLADLWSKDWAFSHLSANPDASTSMEIIPHLMTFRRSLNTGALFGMGKGLVPLFIAASVVALAFVLYLFYHSSRERRSLHVALGLVLAGALGNMYDRVFMVADVVHYTVGDREYADAVKRLPELDRPGVKMVGTWPNGEHPRPFPDSLQPRFHQQGVVRDFVKMEPRFTVAGQHIEIWPWVFNIADVLLVVGVGLLMLNFWWERKAERAAHQQASQSP
ncbi:MAG: signal peptidase II [Phycisphaerae bacterium]|nr:signal peptidase II [Phycisphaerae bacterium]